MKRINLLMFLLAFSIGTFAQNNSIKKSNNNNLVSQNKSATQKLSNPIVSNGTINGNDKEKLKALQKRLEAQNKKYKEEAIKYAKANNIPTKRVKEDGGLVELMRVLPDGTLLYNETTSNVAAAISTRANYLNTGGGLGLDLNGDNMTAYIWDGGHARVTHREYDGAGGNNRVSIGDTPLNLNFHAAHVTGTIVASGFQSNAKGMAWQANAISYDWTNDTGEVTAATLSGSNNNFGALISNHSYGLGMRLQNGDPALPGWFLGRYFDEARDWDEIMYDAPYYLMVGSAGNDGTDDTANSDPMEGNSVYDKLSGFKVAKNNLVVASGDDAVIAADGSLTSVRRSVIQSPANSFSSEGPTDDYRIKPDIMGNGTNLTSSYEGADNEYGTISGTSMASPNVAGTLLLLQEYYYDLYTTYMRSATLRGLALHTADDVTPSNVEAGNGVTLALVGPDATTGWGLLNAKKAAETIEEFNNGGDAIIEERTLNNGQSYTMDILANGAEPLQVSITWTDPAGPVNNFDATPNLTDPALVNDLDANLTQASNTFYPWRLTSVNTNANNAENNVDNIERIDITNASGVYTLTVNHDGSLSSGSQDYTIIVTGGRLAPTGPEIAFTTTEGNALENSDCSYTDYDVDLTIGAAPSGDAEITFTIDGASTAASGVDFDLMTSTVMFPGGSLANQTMTLRVYEDAFIEGDETIIVNAAITTNLGDATLNAAFDTFTFTINNDDVTPIATNTLTVFNEDFQNTTGWTIIDADGDGENWAIFNPFTHGNLSGSWAGSITDLAVVGETGVLDPDNYFSSPQITIPAGVVNAELTFEIGDFGARERYAVYFSTDKNTNTQILAGTLLETRRVSNGVETETRTIDITALAGQTGYLSFRHFNTGGDTLLMLDTIDIEVTQSTEVQSAANSGTGNEPSILLNASGTAYASDTNTGNIMVSIVNNQSDDYGCTTIAIDRDGTNAQSYNGSVAPNLVLDKRFTFSPTNNITNGDVMLSFYVTEAELAGWEADTGLSRNALYIGREVSGSITETIPATISAFSVNSILSGDFEGVEGDFYFGPLAAFGDCLGVTKTWNGSAWSPAGAPDASNPVVINGAYDFSNGEILGCSLTINNGITLSIPAGNFINIEGDITVNGTLIVEHQGSVVQVDNTASVTKGASGVINVDVTTPVLNPKDFMLIGSPMDNETRENLFIPSYRVLESHPQNFMPHTNVPVAFGINFADDNTDNWINYPSGAINEGSAYLLRPENDETQPASSYDITFSQGTLNNGDFSIPVTYNGATNNPGGTLNMIANPYPSAISVVEFLEQNPSVNEIYFWEHITTPNGSLPGAYTLNYSMEDISRRNISAGTAAGNDGSGTTAPGENIASAQGFIVIVTDNTPIVFNNTMRVTSENNTLRTEDENLIDQIGLRVTDARDYVGGNAVLAFNPKATSEYDPGYDSKSIATIVSLFTLDGTSDTANAYGIQTIEPFNDSMEIPLGFASQIDEEYIYTISINSIEGNNIDREVVLLRDNYNGTTVNLSDQDYEFKSTKGIFNDRFTILFKGQTVLGTQEQNLEELITVFPNPANDYITINTREAIKSIQVYDIQGRLVKNVDGISTKTEQTINLQGLENSMYLVKVNTENGTSFTKRIIKK